jgi:hypothetical protein
MITSKYLLCTLYYYQIHNHLNYVTLPNSIELRSLKITAPFFHSLYVAIVLEQRVTLWTLCQLYQPEQCDFCYY